MLVVVRVEEIEGEEVDVRWIARVEFDEVWGQQSWSEVSQLPIPSTSFGPA